MILHKIGRIDQLDAFLCKLVRDTADQRVRIPPRQAPQHLYHPHVGHRSREDLHMLDLAAHQGLFDLVLLEESDHLAELPDADPLDGKATLVDRGVRFLLDGDYGKARPGTSSAVDREEREFTIAGDETVFHEDRLL